MSELTQAMIINGVILVAALHNDVGQHRKIGLLRILLPLGIAAGVIPLFLSTPVTHGTGLALELAGAIGGILFGLAATALMSVYRSPETGKPVSRAGGWYAALWIVVVAARAAFSWGAIHWFSPQLGHWMFAHQVTTAAITDALIFMAVGMLVTRTLGLGIRAAALPTPSTHPMATAARNS
jgi:hypothetical protein